MSNQVFYRVQRIGHKLSGHTSKLASEPVDGIFVFEDPEDLYGTYTWIRVRKNLDAFEMIELEGVVVDRPSDSEGVVVRPTREIRHTPMVKWEEERQKRMIKSKKTTGRAKASKKLTKKPVKMTTKDLLEQLASALSTPLGSDERRRIVLSVRTSKQEKKKARKSRGR